MKYFSLALLIMLISVSIRAEPISAIKLSGKIISFDSQTVTLDQSGKKLVVPRASIASAKLANGDNVEASLTPEQYQVVKQKYFGLPQKTK